MAKHIAPRLGSMRTPEAAAKRLMASHNDDLKQATSAAYDRVIGLAADHRKRQEEDWMSTIRKAEIYTPVALHQRIMETHRLEPSPGFLLWADTCAILERMLEGKTPQNLRGRPELASKIIQEALSEADQIDPTRSQGRAPRRATRAGNVLVLRHAIR